MTALEALVILESATVECKKRDINTPEIRAALNFLDPHILPAWLVPQFRHHIHRDGNHGGKRRVNNKCSAQFSPPFVNQLMTYSESKWTPWLANSRRLTT
jgi:hypothetical protein